MRRNPFKPYLAFIKGGIMDVFSYKFSIYGWIIGDIITMVIYCFLWIAVYASSPTPDINGFTLQTMLAYIVTSRIINNLASSSQSFFIVGSDIREGTIANALIRPVNYRTALGFGAVGGYIGIFIIGFLPLFIPALLILNWLLGVPFPLWYNLLFFILSSFFSMMIIDAFDFIIAQVAFNTGALFGVMLVKDALYSFLSGALIPLTFFPSWAQIIFRYLPFSSMLQTPAFIVLGRYDIPGIVYQIAMQILWVVILNGLAYFAYSRAVKRVVSVGG